MSFFIFYHFLFTFCLFIIDVTFIISMTLYNRHIQMGRQYQRDRRYSQSDGHSSYDQRSSQQPQQLLRQLKQSFQQNNRYSQKLIYSISKKYKESVGILRITLPQTFTFSQNDMDEFFRKWGKIQNIIVKQTLKNPSDDQIIKKQQSIAYVIYSQYFSALLALRVLNSIQDKIISAKVCHLKTQSPARLFSQPLIGSISQSDMIIQVDEDYQFGIKADGYKYKGVIGLDLNDKTWGLKMRILGIRGCNFIRVQYMCEKMYRFEHQEEEYKVQELVLKLVYNKKNDTEREVLVMCNSLEKYNQAMKLLHQLLEQIVQQYKNSRQKSMQIIPKDIHIKKWQKFSIQSQLKFLNP